MRAHRRHSPALPGIATSAAARNPPDRHRHVPAREHDPDDEPGKRAHGKVDLEGPPPVEEEERAEPEEDRKEQGRQDDAGGEGGAETWVTLQDVGGSVFSREIVGAKTAGREIARRGPRAAQAWAGAVPATGCNGWWTNPLDNRRRLGYGPALN